MQPNAITPALRRLTPTVQAVVNNRRIEVESWSIDREIRTEYPQRLVGGSGITAATGRIVCAPGQRVSQNLLSLIEPTAFVSPGTQVRLEAGYQGTTPARMLTGFVEEVNQGISTNSTAMDVIDYIGYLDRTFTHEAFFDVMPPRMEGLPRRSVGIYAEYLVDYAIRRGGFQATPSGRWRVGVFAPMMGSVWPHVGTLQTSGDIDRDSSTGVAFSSSAWGYGLTNASCTYVTERSLTVANGVEITVCVDWDKHTAGAVITANFGTSTINLSISPSGVSADIGGGQPVSLDTPAERYTLRVTSGGLLLASSNGQRASNSATISGVLETIGVEASQGACIGGLLVETPRPYEPLYPVTNWVQNAKFQVGVLHEPLYAVKDYSNQNIMDFLREVSDALLCAMWLDEQNVFHWVHSNILSSGPVVREFSTNSSLLDYTLTDRLSARLDSVMVSSLTPQITRYEQPRKSVWQGNGEVINIGETATYIVSPTDDETWVGVDIPYKIVYPQTYIQANHSFIGGAHPVNDDAEKVADPSTYETTWSRITPGVWKLEVKNISGAPLAQHVPTGAGFPVWHEGAKLPVIRASGYAQWVKDTASSTSSASGPSIYEHDAGIWVQRASHRQRLADYMAASLTRGLLEIDSIEVIPDYGLQMGDKVRLADPVVANLTVTGIVVGVSRTGAGPDVSMSIRIQVLSIALSQSSIYPKDPGAIIDVESIIYNVDTRNASKTVTQIDSAGGLS